jgi:hypothetical protein
VSKTNGFLQLRRGLWEHVRDGRLTRTKALVYIYMLTQADTRSGVWNGSAGAIAGELAIPKSTAKYVLQKLDGAYIRRFATPGRHFCYPILLHKFLVTDGQQIGLRLDALSSTSPTALSYVKEKDLQQVVPQIVQQVGPQKRIENREQRKEPEAKPTPPADSRFQLFLDFAFGSFIQKHGQKPTWGDRDFKALSAMLASNKSLSAAELERRFRNYLDSTEQFTAKHGGSLAYFCAHADSFLSGPILERNKPNGNYPSKASSIETTLEGYRQLRQARTD